MAELADTAQELKQPLDPNVVLVASGKGGVGKTWFSTTLAHALAEEKKKILLFDGDLGLANVDIQLGLMPEKDLSAVVAGQCSLQEATIHYQEGNYDILAGKSGGGQLATLSQQRLLILHESLRKIAPHYDTVLVDLGAGVGGTVRILSQGAANCLVVTNDEPTSLTDAYAFIKVMRIREPNMKLHIVVNMADSEGHAKRTYETLRKSCEAFLKYTPEYAGFILRDRKVIDAIRHQTGLLIRHPHSAAAGCIRTIAKRLLTTIVSDKSQVAG